MAKAADHIRGSLSQGAGAAGQVEGANNALLPQAGHRDRIFFRLGVLVLKKYYRLPGPYLPLALIRMN